MSHDETQKTRRVRRVVLGLAEGVAERPRQVTGVDAQMRAFRIGSVFITTNAMGQLTDDDVLAGLARHVRCDWGELCPEDKAANEAALRLGARLLSAYRSAAGVKFWIITEWDRSATTVLMPEDY